MKKFPTSLHVENKANFKDLNYSRVSAYLRRDIYEHIISSEEKDYFDIDAFDKKWLNNTEVMKRMVQTIREELHGLGWNTETSFGGTGLFIFANTRPRNCFPDGF